MRAPSRVAATKRAARRAGTGRSRPAWDELATFVIYVERRRGDGSAELRIVAHHMESGRRLTRRQLAVDVLDLWMKRCVGTAIGAGARNAPHPVL